MRVVKLMASLVVFSADAICEGLRRMMGGCGAAKCVVLYYHSIPARQRARFARQMDVLVRHACPLSADSKEELSPGRRYAIVTFDDANANIIANALPELKSREIPVTLFVITDKLGRIPDWQNFAADFTEDDRIMTQEQLLTLPCPLIKFGSHTMNHVLLTSVDIEAARREIEESGRKLERMVKLPVRTFSFPYGAYNEALLESCRAAGYERVFTTDPVFALRQSNEFAVGRVVAEPTDWGLEFRLKLAGAYRWLNVVSKLKRWILGIFVSASA